MRWSQSQPLDAAMSPRISSSTAALVAVAALRPTPPHSPAAAAAAEEVAALRVNRAPPAARAPPLRSEPPAAVPAPVQVQPPPPLQPPQRRPPRLRKSGVRSRKGRPRRTTCTLQAVEWAAPVAAMITIACSCRTNTTRCPRYRLHYRRRIHRHMVLTAEIRTIQIWITTGLRARVVASTRSRRSALPWSLESWRAYLLRWCWLSCWSCGSSPTAIVAIRRRARRPPPTDRTIPMQLCLATRVRTARTTSRGSTTTRVVERVSSSTTTASSRYTTDTTATEVAAEWCPAEVGRWATEAMAGLRWQDWCSPRPRNATRRTSRSGMCKVVEKKKRQRRKEGRSSEISSN